MGVDQFDGTRWTSFLLSDLGGNNSNSSILGTRDGTIWVSGNGGRLHAYRNGVWTIYKPPDVPVSTVRILDLLEASEQPDLEEHFFELVSRYENSATAAGDTEPANEDGS